ncbi:Metalloenzyme, LuxS/M16 peptidase-like protein [Mycena rebaudengoi]|nr:Metalloenzyme, LuxS/M16 peptidase-like protein [Mycena rebaudengoi]
MATAVDWERVTPADAPAFQVFKKPLQKSPQDDREYRVIRLQNGLEAMLVHDAKADKAAASLDVAVGHLDDPDDMPGLAHFCEHLLFMGTEEFPRENEYSEFLAKNNGGSNAYTSTSNTNYHFNVATTALPGALARFAGFFHSPLFAPSCTSRELNAVDSEHKKNHQADMWRIFQLSKHLSIEGHPWRKFGSGNRDSLSAAAKRLKAKGKLEASNNFPEQNGHLAPSPIPSRLSSPTPSISSTDSSETEADGGAVGRETRRRLMEWWSREYCASRMRLCVVGNESLDELAILASTLFSPILNRGADPLPMTIMTFHALEISFPLEWQAPFWRHKPMSFISHFVGHEGPGSIHSYLKGKGWITALSCAPQNLARGLSAFKITVYLTIDGFHNHRQVSLAVFKFLSLLRASEFAAFHQHELVTLSATKFRFKEKGRPDSYATWAAEHMTRPVPLELVLSAQALTWEWDGDDLPGGGGEKKVREYLDSFRVENARVTLMAKGEELKQLAPNAVWEAEPWYGTEYFVEKFDQEFVKQAQGENDITEMYLPGPNEFIPTNVEVDKREPLKRPHLIRETPKSILWHKKDDRFWVPKAHAIIDLRSPFGNSSPRAAILTRRVFFALFRQPDTDVVVVLLTRLYSDVVNDALTEFAYDASLGMLEYNFVPHTNGLYVAMNGFNDKMSVLVKHVLEKIKGIVVKDDRLAVMKEQAKRDLENFFLGQSYALSDYYGRYIMSQQQWTMEQLLEQLPSVTSEELQKHITLLLSEVHMRMLVTGNIYKDEAVKIAEMAEEGLGPSKLPPSELNDHALIIPPASNHTWTSIIPNINQANSALTYFVHFGSIILQEPAFNVLRTQEQLGYIVSCSGWLLAGQGEKGLRIVVQSEKTPGYLEDRVEAFLEGMKTTLEDMSAEEFAEHKESLKNDEKDAEFIQSVTKEDVLNMFLSDLHPASKTRSKLSVHMRSQKPRPPKVSSAAAEAFVALVRSKGLVETVTEAVLKDAPGGDDAPSLPDFERYWKAVLNGDEGGRELFAMIPDLVAKYPVPGEGEDAPRPGVTYITDLNQFKKGLEVSVDPGPMVGLGRSSDFQVLNRLNRHRRPNNVVLII